MRTNLNFNWIYHLTLIDTFFIHIFYQTWTDKVRIIFLLRMIFDLIFCRFWISDFLYRCVYHLNNEFRLICRIWSGNRGRHLIPIKLWWLTSNLLLIWFFMKEINTTHYHPPPTELGIGILKNLKPAKLNFLSPMPHSQMLNKRQWNFSFSCKRPAAHKFVMIMMMMSAATQQAIYHLIRLCTSFLIHQQKFNLTTFINIRTKRSRVQVPRAECQSFHAWRWQQQKKNDYFVGEWTVKRCTGRV